MRLLHGSNIEIKEVDLSKCKSHNDFGRGFYLTPSWQRAWAMGRRRVAFGGGTIVVNAFIFNVSEAQRNNLNILEFKNFSIAWARFVIVNRENKNINHDYDIVIGPVADAVFDSVLAQYKEECGEKYLEDNNLKKFIGSISQFGLNYIQYCFCTQRALDILYKD